MPKLLTHEQIQFYGEHGYLFPIRVMSEESALAYRQKLEAFEAKHPESVHRIDLKAHLLCPWVYEIAMNPKLLDAVEDLIGSDIILWSSSFRNKAPDRRSYSGWHQDGCYVKVTPIEQKPAVMFALSECSVESGCLQVIPDSHKHGLLPHEDTDDKNSMLTRGQRIAVPFDQSKAVNMLLKPGEIGLFHSYTIHGAPMNRSNDRRLTLINDYIPASVQPSNNARQTAILVRGVDRYGHFAPEILPDEEHSDAALAEWRRAVEIQAGASLYKDSKLYTVAKALR